MGSTFASDSSADAAIIPIGVKPVNKNNKISGE